MGVSGGLSLFPRVVLVLAIAGLHRDGPHSRETSASRSRLLSAAAASLSHCSASVAPSARLRHGRTPSISTSSEKTSNVLTSTITPRTPTFLIVGDTATVRIEVGGDKNFKADQEPASGEPAASPIGDASGLAADEIASNGK